ncbi:MAG: YbaN family protein [Spirochaetales bacterium]|nr:YbaN family protein [Spirochaetales bacterium]
MQKEPHPVEKADLDLKKTRGSILFRGSLVFCGSLSVVLGVLGIFLPLLPTTPFFLLAAACYSRSSKAFYLWLVNNPFIGKYILNYREKRIIPLKAKISSLAILWLTIILSIIFIVPWIWLKIVLLIVAAAVSFHILGFKSSQD